MTPYYQDAFVTIYHGDCVDVLDGIDERFGLAFADPPYNHGITYDGYKDSQDPLGYELWCSIWFKQLRDRADRIIVTPGHGNLRQWTGRLPSGVACWYKPGNPAKGGVFQFCEWEPVLVWGKAMGGSDVLRATVSSQSCVGDHPCPKPLALMRQLISRAKPASVLDPFMGSGSTLVAAKERAIPCVGIEQSERYCEIAAKRLAQEVLDLGA